MKMGTVKCSKCEMNSVRNIHNKCIYCGQAFPEKHHVTESEKTERLDQIEATTERLKGEIKDEKERQKRREEEAKNNASVNFNNGIF